MDPLFLGYRWLQKTGASEKPEREGSVFFKSLVGGLKPKTKNNKSTEVVLAKGGWNKMKEPTRIGFWGLSRGNLG